MHRLALSRRQLLQAGAAASVLTVPWAPAQKAAATPLPAVGAGGRRPPRAGGRPGAAGRRYTFTPSMRRAAADTSPSLP